MAIKQKLSGEKKTRMNIYISGLSLGIKNTGKYKSSNLVRQSISGSFSREFSHGGYCSRGEDNSIRCY